jgi:acyl-CoA hydrolase
MFRRALPLLALAVAACRHSRADRPPRAEFLVAAGDSTFWVHSGSEGIRARGSPLQLAHYGGRFYEIYVVDDDRSYPDAEIVGQQVWRRDLITGDSALVFTDTTIAGIERWYARAHPDAQPLDPDEDLNPDPHVSATSELDILDQFGPYVSYEYRADLTVSGGDEWHATRRGVLDLRRGGSARLAELFGERNARYLERRGATLFTQALDSVLASRDARARAASRAIGDFEFDSTSFALVTVDHAPAVEFVAPGHGSRGGGLILPLPPIRVAPPPWWDDASRSLPARSDTSGDAWMRGSYRVLAREQDDGDTVRLTLVDSAGRRWPVAALPAPARRIYWLDSAATDSTTRRALARAFDEAALYSDDARTAMTDHPTPHTDPGTLASRPARPVRASQHETSEIMMPQHANVLGHVFGGVILSMMDKTAAVAAIRHVRGNCVTVSVDRVDFREPIHVGDLVIMKASVNYAGRTSLEVGVRVEAEDLVGGVRRHTNSCYLTFVAIDRNGRPVEVPQVVPETEVERRRYAAAMDRRRRRLEERTAEEG